MGLCQGKFPRCVPSTSEVEIFSIPEESAESFFSYCAKESIIVVDTIKEQMDELAKIQRVEQPQLNIKALPDKELGQSNPSLSSYGSWIYYPWRHTLVHVLPEEAFDLVRTNRNQEKITASEQSELSKKRIGVIGLSVGHSAALTLVQEGVCGEIRIADFDRIELSNLNRLRTSLTHLGHEKTVSTCRDLLEINPYMKIKVYKEGITEENIEAFFLKDGKLDLVVEECDSLATKIKSRLCARKHGIPVIMDTNDRGLIDIERFDQEPNRDIFHGILGDSLPDSVVNLSQTETLNTIFKLLGGRENLSSAMQHSIEKLGKTLVGFPQLASEVHLGGALVTHVARHIFLEKKMLSGRYYVELSELVGV